MSEFSHDWVLMPQAQAVFDTLTADERAGVLKLIERVSHNPEPDDALIHDLSVPPVDLCLADDSSWTIAFNTVPSFVMQVLAIMPSPLRGIEP